MLERKRAWPHSWFLMAQTRASCSKGGEEKGSALTLCLSLPSPAARGPSAHPAQSQDLMAAPALTNTPQKTLPHSQRPLYLSTSHDDKNWDLHSNIVFPGFPGLCCLLALNATTVGSQPGHPTFSACNPPLLLSVPLVSPEIT